MLAKGATPEDCVATITRITAKSLAHSYKRWSPPGGIDEIYLGGGGSYNPNIIMYLREQLPKTNIQFLDVIGIPCGSREAMSFSFKGLECIVGRSLIVPTHVESDKAGIIGHIQPGAGFQYHWLMKHVQDFWGNWPLEKRMDPVLEMEIVKDANGVAMRKHA
ncbi:Anhydro-N-acetylmuramic acid kinase [Lachnellula occidentalis]|uniref:Anhydro-N-acetylmuramic acid kinase n=1 Tax=Lachnellula occidentalis TaxID=215460 RepID=A0A8H8U8G9_9HELO|nr:Anhydro-N-acetylmuramic acid kinase [Lachnellula occidentalis]